MWDMTKFGILMPCIRPPHTVRSGDPRKLQVRARKRVHLERLRDRYMGAELGRIIHSPDKDYNYRAYCTHEAYAQAVAQMVMEIDYEKFKPETEDDDLHGVYNSIWGTVTRLGTPWEKYANERKARTTELDRWWDERSSYTDDDRSLALEYPSLFSHVADEDVDPLDEECDHGPDEWCVDCPVEPDDGETVEDAWKRVDAWLMRKQVEAAIEAEERGERSADRILG